MSEAVKKRTRRTTVKKPREELFQIVEEETDEKLWLAFGSERETVKIFKLDEFEKYVKENAEKIETFKPEKFENEDHALGIYEYAIAKTENYYNDVSVRLGDFTDHLSFLDMATPVSEEINYIIVESGRKTYIVGNSKVLEDFEGVARTYYHDWLARRAGGELDEIVVASIPDKLFGVLTLSVENGFTEEKTVIRNKAKHIVYTRRALELRDRVEKLINLLSEWSGGQTSYAKLLVFAGVKAFGNHRFPSINVHVIGAPGTFKTVLPTHALRMAFKKDYAVLVVKYEDDPKTVFNHVYGRLLEETRSFMNEIVVGGLVRRIDLDKKRRTITLVIDKKMFEDFSGKTIDEFVRSLRVEARATVVREPLSAGIVHGANVYDLFFNPFLVNVDYLNEIGSFRVLNRELQNDILVVDEASRDMKSVERLLTILSLGSIIYPFRIVVMTDNLEPFLDAVEDPRMTALHDRTYHTMTGTVATRRSELFKKSDEILGKIEENALTPDEIDRINRIMDAIPVPPITELLMEAIALELSHRLDRAEAPVFFLKPEAGLEPGDKTVYSIAEALENTEFVGGGRFLEHTLWLSKFNAFLDGKPYIDLEVLRKTLWNTASGRIKTLARNYAEYSIRTSKLLSRIDNQVKTGMNDLIEGVELAFEIVKTKTDEQADRVKEKLSDIATNVKTHPLAYYGLVAALVRLYSEGQIRKDSLHPELKTVVYTILVGAGIPIENLEMQIGEDVKKYLA